MDQQRPRRDRLVELRRDLHRRPEPAWREFYTTDRILQELERIGVDDLYVGPEVLDADQRLCLPDEEAIDRWFDRALEAGARADVIAELRGGHTGAVAVLRRGEGPTVGLRVDIDALPIEESDDPDHHPAAAGFRSATEGTMHACGHDAHAAIGVGVLEAIAASDFAGTLKVFFQPAEEVVGGGRPLATGGHLDDVDYLLAVHVGLDHPTGTVVAGVEGFLAVTQVRADFAGEPAHAGMRPADGHNAVQAMATAVQNLYAIPRHQAGKSRVNVGTVGGGTATNVVPAAAHLAGEVRGGTTAVRDYVLDRAESVLEHAAAMHDCDVDVTVEGEAPSAESDAPLAAVVYDVAGDVAGVTSRIRRATLDGSEDATYLMQHVQERGGLAAYVAVGTDHPGGHHTATFDVDEESLPIGVDVLSGAIRRIAEEVPDRTHPDR